MPPGWGLGSGAPCGTLRRCRRLCRRQRALQGQHLPPFRLQLWPVSFGNVSLKRSPTPGFPRNTKGQGIGAHRTRNEMWTRLLPHPTKLTQPSSTWAGLRAGAATLETVWRLLRKLQIEPPCDQQVKGLSSLRRYRCSENRDTCMS